MIMTEADVRKDIDGYLHSVGAEFESCCFGGNVFVHFAGKPDDTIRVALKERGLVWQSPACVWVHPMGKTARYKKKWSHKAAAATRKVAPATRKVAPTPTSTSTPTSKNMSVEEALAALGITK